MTTATPRTARTPPPSPAETTHGRTVKALLSLQIPGHRVLTIEISSDDDVAVGAVLVGLLKHLQPPRSRAARQALGRILNGRLDNG